MYLTNFSFLIFLQDIFLNFICPHFLHNISNDLKHLSKILLKGFLDIRIYLNFINFQFLHLFLIHNCLMFYSLIKKYLLVYKLVLVQMLVKGILMDFTDDFNVSFLMTTDD